LILGTAGYMAPEQAKGRTVDARSDIWAFGCVLYEMLVGKTAFSGESVVEVLSAILHLEPDWKALPATTPPAILALLQRCLQKDPNLRLRDIADARFQIEDLQSPAAVVVPSLLPSRVPVRRSRERAAWIAIVALLAAGVVALSLQRGATSPARPTEMRLQIVTPPEASPSAFSLSPDGRNLVYTSQAKLWLRPLDSEKAELLPGTEGSSQLTFWSPDSLAIGFGTSDHLKRFDIRDKLARTLSNVPAGTGFRSASWNAAGNLLIGSAGDHLPLYLLGSSNGGATEATQLAPEQTTQGYPYFLPDGNHFLLFGRTISRPGDLRRLARLEANEVSLRCRQRCRLRPAGLRSVCPARRASRAAAESGNVRSRGRTGVRSERGLCRYVRWQHECARHPGCIRVVRRE
jgi:hypothetical protein